MSRRLRMVWFAACAAFALIALAAVSVALTQGDDEPQYRVVVPNVAKGGDVSTTATETATTTLTATSTATETATASPTASRTASPTETATATATLTASPTGTATETATTSPTPSGTPQSLPTTTLSVTDGEASTDITVQIADDATERGIGLMHVTSMPENEGMLFVFNRQGSAGFWMKNTYIPLDIAYLDADGTVMEIHQREAHDATSVRPEDPYWMVLEMNSGWFERNGFGVGDRVVIPDEFLPD